MPRTLPDPAWAPPGFCVRCGYLLTGLTAPGRCPECGAPFLEQQLVLYGVPRTGTSRGRRATWALLIVAAAIFSQTWVVLLMHSWMLGAAIGITIIAGLIALVLTSRRERGGAERLVFSPLGVVRLPLQNPDEHERFDSAVVSLRGVSLVELRRISPMWYRLRLGTIWPGGERLIVLDAGIRCPDALAAEVRQAIEGHLRQAQEVAAVEPPSA